MKKNGAKIERAAERRIEHAVDILAHGGTVVFPTETLYGLGALATNRAAVKKVYSIKQRQKEKLLPVIVGDLKQAKKYFTFTSADRKLAKKFWPGPLSLVLTAKSKELTASLGSKRIAVRWPANTAAATLTKRAGAPITSTSANISGQPGCSTIAAVKKQFAGKPIQPDLFFDGGRLKKSLPSTILETNSNALTIIREGAISSQALVHFLSLSKTSTSPGS